MIREQARVKGEEMYGRRRAVVVRKARGAVRVNFCLALPSFRFRGRRGGKKVGIERQVVARVRRR